MENDQTAPNAAAASAPQTAQTAPQTGIPNLTDGLGAVLSNPELMAKLPQMMAMPCSYTHPTLPTRALVERP